jgi:hypothetical protein
MHWPTCIFWANLTLFSLKLHVGIDLEPRKVSAVRVAKSCQARLGAATLEYAPVSYPIVNRVCMASNHGHAAT